MKPKERYLNYALLSSANCDRSQSPPLLKQDIPIDLSTKRVTPNGHNFGLYPSYEHVAPFQSPPHGGTEWPPAKYCFPANLVTSKQYGYSPAILPYLFINPNCIASEHGLKRKHEDPVYEQFATLPYRLPQEGLIFPLKLDHQTYESLYRQHGGSEARNRPMESTGPPLSSGESCSSSMSSSPHDQFDFHRTEIAAPSQYTIINEHVLAASPKIGAQKRTSTANSPIHNGSQSLVARGKLRKSLSQPNLSINNNNSNNNNNFKNNNNNNSNYNTNKYANGNTIAAATTTTTEETRTPLRRSQSEQNLHLIKSVQSTSSPQKILAPKKMFVSSYYQNMHQNGINKNNSRSNDSDSSCCNGSGGGGGGGDTTSGNNKENNPNKKSSNGTMTTTTTRFYRNYRKEVIESWDNENKDNGRLSEADVLDLRTSHNVAHKLMTSNGGGGVDEIRRSNVPPPSTNDVFQTETETDSTTTTAATNVTIYDDRVADFERIFAHRDHAFHSPTKQPQQQSSPPAVALPLDIYRQYYYYLIQEPSFASRAAAVAVAETYAKLMHSNAAVAAAAAAAAEIGKSENCAFSAKSTMAMNEKYVENCLPTQSTTYEAAAAAVKRTSPDFILSGSRAELRSADTTNAGLPFDRKRISRPLTGKHVRHGTGASPATLVSLRNMIQQRQKLKEIGQFDSGNRFKSKANKRIKRK